MGEVRTSSRIITVIESIAGRTFIEVGDARFRPPWPIEAVDVITEQIVGVVCHLIDNPGGGVKGVIRIFNQSHEE